MSDLVVSGTVERTVQAGGRTVDGTDVTGNIALSGASHVLRRELPVTTLGRGPCL
jgi:hypothetical protein